MTVECSNFPSSLDTHPQAAWSWPRIVAVAGLPCLISVAALDPGNLEVDLQAGNRLGYHLLWVLLFSSIVGWVLQTLAAHLTVLTGFHLAELCAIAYRPFPFLSRSLFVIAEVSIISFDIAEVVGTAFALKLLFGWPLWFGMLMSAIDTMLVLYLQRSGMSRIELLIEGMLFILAACMFYELVLSRPSFASMLGGSLIPTFGERPREGMILGLGILGSIVMSHNLFLHSWLLKERCVRDAADGTVSEMAPNASFFEHQWAQTSKKAACQYATIEAAAIFVATFLINGCVISVTAAFPHGSAEGTVPIGLNNAGTLLQNVLGSRFASTAWAIGLLASGHAATVTGTLASQAVCEGFLGLGNTGSSSMILATRAVAILPAVVAALVAGEKGSDNLIVLSQIALSLSLPFAIIPMLRMLLELSRRGEGGKSLLTIGFVAFVVLLGANIFALVHVCADLDMLENRFVLYFVECLGAMAGCLIVRLLVTPLHTEIPISGEKTHFLASLESQPLLPNRVDDST